MEKLGEQIALTKCMKTLEKLDVSQVLQTLQA